MAEPTTARCWPCRPTSGPSRPRPRWTRTSPTGSRSDTAKVRVFATAAARLGRGPRPGRRRPRACRRPTGAMVLTGGLPSRSADFMASFSASVPVAVADRGAGHRRRPVPDLRIGVPADQGGADEPDQHQRQLRRAGLHLPAGPPAGPARLRRLRDARRLAAGDHVRDPFGLSMDYEVLLLSRIRERYLATATTRGPWPRGSA